MPQLAGGDDIMAENDPLRNEEEEEEEEEIVEQPQESKKKKKKKKKYVVKCRVYNQIGHYFDNEPVDIIMNKKKLTYESIQPEDPLFRKSFQSHCIGNMPELTTLLQDETILERFQSEEAGEMLINIGRDTRNAFKYLDTPEIKFLIKKILEQVDKVSRETRGEQYVWDDKFKRHRRYEEENWPECYKTEIDPLPTEPRPATPEGLRVRRNSDDD